VHLLSRRLISNFLKYNVFLFVRNYTRSYLPEVTSAFGLSKEAA
jgi:hypothetical protein